ncbi:4Fe-4S binding protein [Lacrimispora sp. NSJ-141]|uniref:4Fe-4S binding protein n=1 Tax=Lientehia hominis TaxID=2897778 RepID=A0AAP2RK82_9FIRM|nr:4Fe-4S binding protein [Lientehia hominis]MCD2493441.1 4Fe-4S binding protein [Lientehia hominis]
MKKRARLWVQVGFSALTNGYLLGFVKGKIFTGPTKAVCVPGLNCYSCPGALGSCPIGSLQAVLGSRNYRFSFYVIGFLMLIGSLAGRFVCGWLCPFGLIQDLLYKIPFIKKRKNLPGHKVLVWMKYVILAVFVIILPLFAVDIVGQGSPWFCQYICPSGTLTGGIPLVLLNEPLRGAIGWLFHWKMAVLLLMIFLSVIVYRPFCKYICPLGAIYSLFNPIALYRYQVDPEKCTRCGKCQKACKMDIRVWETPNSRECIRCGDCLKSCPHGAICSGMGKKKETTIVKDGRQNDE